MNLLIRLLDLQSLSHEINVIKLLGRKPLFLYEAPLLRHQSPVRGRGALGYNDSDVLEIL